MMHVPLRYTMVVSDHDSEWAKIYDGRSKRQFLRAFNEWCRRDGVRIMIICPFDTDPMLESAWEADVSIWNYTTEVRA